MKKVYLNEEAIVHKIYWHSHYEGMIDDCRCIAEALYARLMGWDNED